MIIVIISGRCLLLIVVIIIVVAPEEVLSRHVALPNYTENCSLFCSPWILETVTIKTINNNALIITENFDLQNVKKKLVGRVIRVSYNLNDSFQ